MNVFYNVKGIGDTLIITIKEIENKMFERKGDVARIYNEKTNETGGFNLFNASAYIEVNAQGEVDLNEEIVVENQ